jgi:hypothetical protein
MMKTHPQKHGLAQGRFSGIIHLGANLRRRLDWLHVDLGQGENIQRTSLAIPGQHTIRSAVVEAERAKARAMAELRRYALLF